MDLVSRRCRRTLRRLRMTHSVNLLPAYYAHFFSGFSSLRQLDLRASMVDDTAFAAIGRSCPCLMELDASRTWMTDVGLRHLSLVSDGEEEKERPSCPRLVRLSVSDTRVTPEGLRFFLRHHPGAEAVDHEESLHIFDDEKGLDDGDDVGEGEDKGDFMPGWNLTRLSSSATVRPMSSSSHYQVVTLRRPGAGCLSRALRRCRRLRSLAVTQPGLRDDGLRAVADLGGALSELHLANPEGSMRFREGVRPILQSGCGARLRKLALEQFREVDVGVIGDACPQLRHLALSEIG